MPTATTDATAIAAIDRFRELEVEYEAAVARGEDVGPVHRRMAAVMAEAGLFEEIDSPD